MDKSLSEAPALHTSPQTVTVIDVNRWIVISFVLLGALGLGTALKARDVSPEKAIAHEPIPRADGLRAKPSSDPVFVFEQSVDDSDTGSRVEMRSPSQPSTADDSQLLYRPAGTLPDSMTDTIHSVEPEIRPDKATGIEPWLNYHAVFDPAVIPFKRNSSKDQLRADGSLVVGNLQLTEVQVVGNRASSGFELFRGSVMLELSPTSPSPMPSVAPESRLLVVQSSPQIQLRFFKDGADNFFVSGGDFSGRINLTFMMDAPSAWFSRSLELAGAFSDVPAHLRPALPSVFKDEVAEVTRRIGLTPGDEYAVALRKLVLWFRSFKAADLPKDGAGSLYRQIALNQKGVCRHRVYAFVVTAHGVGIPARYVANEAHVFAEVYVPGTRAGWMRIDLGGGAQGMNVSGGAEKTRYSSVADDPFGFPEGFEAGYSHQALLGLSGASESDGNDTVRGLPPAASRTEAMAEGTEEKVAQLGATSKWAPQGESSRQQLIRQKTVTTLSHVSAQAFRGERLAVAGRVMSAGKPVVGGAVRIVVIDRTKTRLLRVLGRVNTNAAGQFEAGLMIPDDLALGTWEIGAEFVGTSALEPSAAD